MQHFARPVVLYHNGIRFSDKNTMCKSLTTIPTDLDNNYLVESPFAAIAVNFEKDYVAASNLIYKQNLKI